MPSKRVFETKMTLGPAPRNPSIEYICIYNVYILYIYRVSQCSVSQASGKILIFSEFSGDVGQLRPDIGLMQSVSPFVQTLIRTYGDWCSFEP